MPRPERTLETAPPVLAEFAAGLRALRAAAGNPPYRELAGHAHYSATALSEAAGGRRLPTLPVTLAFVAACGGDQDEWRQRWSEASLALADTEPADDRNAPYVGLAPFGADDARWFFGRDRVVDDLASRLERTRFVAVFGASGSGKSSVLRAGLLPRLTGDGATVVTFTPSRRPFAEYTRHADAAGEDLVLVVDQFEELFTLCADEDERRRFLAALCAADSGFRVVIGVRADFYQRCTAYPELVDALREGQVTVGAMTADELRQAIVRPAVAAGCSVEGALVTELVVAATGRPGVLPLLSHVLLQCWHRRRGNALTLSGYHASGGLHGALAQTAEDCWEPLGERQRRLAKELLLRMTALGEVADTKRRITWSEVNESDPDVRVVLAALAKARLVTVDTDSLELAHEALIEAWPRLRGWLSEDRETLRVHRRLTDDAAAWAALDRDSGGLYRGARLALARPLLTESRVDLTALEREFLAAAVAAEERDQAVARRRVRRQRRLIALLAVLLVLVGLTAVVVVDTRRTAVDQRDAALADSAAHHAESLRATDPALATQLGLAAYRLSPTPRARGSLLSAAATPAPTLLRGHADGITSAAFHPAGRLVATSGYDTTARLWEVSTPDRPPRAVAILHGHEEVVSSVAFRAGGDVVATASMDGTARLWNISDPEHPSLLSAVDHGAPAESVSFGPDGTTMVTTGHDPVVRLWNAADPRNPVRIAALEGHRDAVYSARFAPAGRILATASRDHTARLWDLADPAGPRPLATLTGHTAAVSSASFGGRTLVTAGTDRVVRLWDLTVPGAPAALAAIPLPTAATSAALSPDGNTLAATGEDGVLRLWDSTDPRRPQPRPSLPGPGSGMSVTFDAGGGRLAVTGSRHEAQLWDIDETGQVRSNHTELPETPGAVMSGPGSTTVFAIAGQTASTLTAWNTGWPRRRPATVPIPPPSVPFGITPSPDGRRVATYRDGAVVLWDVTDPAVPRRLTAIPEAGQVSTAFDSTGGLLAVVGGNQPVRLWDVTDPGRPTLLSDTIATAAGANFAVGRPLLATVTADNTVVLWDVSDPRRPRRTADPLPDARSVAWAPGGRLLATIGDYTVSLWDTADPARPRHLATLTGHTGPVSAFAFSPDGRTLATASRDHTARLWDVSTPDRPGEVATLTGHTAPVNDLSWRPDGHTLATAGADRTIRLWETRVEHVAGYACQDASAISEAEWNRYLPGLPYRSPCH
ncbi:PD40 domain-containing protein [Amycolatopsis suaedae]|uniref:Novel STAND NTPase 1 domain-containing protein n=1 Tax=Amycolatopsis suaedae TaxID=2510978 RepID=A0A4Q7JF83_9PSEU|nr:PD40 domain-containing protein [Amycolatopsis suaedae]RZQ65866.1 hypothetical protein EWH70_01970 [Amycolatopsis suaedae]